MITLHTENLVTEGVTYKCVLCNLIKHLIECTCFATRM